MVSYTKAIISSRLKNPSSHKEKNSPRSRRQGGKLGNGMEMIVQCGARGEMMATMSGDYKVL